jgi:ABC-type phosphate transport system substrate-binding protein
MGLVVSNFLLLEKIMKAKLLSMAVMAVSMNTMALTPADLPADVELFIGGASAQDKALLEVVSSLCKDTADKYSETGAAPGSSYTAVFCTMSDAQVPGLLPAGTDRKVLIHKRSKGGSAFGAAPVESGDSVTRMLVDASCTLTTAHQYQCTGTTNDVLKAGITDVEPGMFRGVNLLVPGIGGVVAGDPGTAAMTSAQLDRLDKKPTGALTFGVVVTKTLRDALQAVQGLSSGSDEESQMPVLTKSQIASLFAGTVTNWSEFQNASGTPITTAAGVIPPANTRVEICRRTAGSGTQAVTNQYFLNQPCDQSVAPKADNTPASGTAGTGAYTSLVGVTGPAVHWNESSGNVNTCLAALNTANFWGIGLQSLEQTNTAMRFVKIDGVSPLLTNVATGKYDELGITSFQWIKAGQPDALSGNQLVLASKFRNDLSTDTELRSANLGFGGNNITIGGVSVAGQVGWAALASNGFTLNVPFDVTHPVVPFSNRGINGTNDANSCSAKVILGGKSQM